MTGMGLDYTHTFGHAFADLPDERAEGGVLQVNFHDLYEKYAPAVHRFALFLSGNVTTADEITSETFYRAWTAKSEIRQPTVRQYLFTVAKNVFRDSLRKERRNTELDDTLQDPTPTIQKRLELSADVRRLMTALATVPEADRSALVMRYQDEMSNESVAAALGMSETAIRVRLHRARKRLLQAYLDQEEQK